MLIRSFLSLSLAIIFIFCLSNTASANCKPIGIWSDCGEYFVHKLGHTYVGEFKGGRPEGYGRLNFSKNSERAGDYYVGWFREGTMFGEGRYYYSNGDRYFGNFTADVKNGTGLFLRGEEVFEQRFEFGLLKESIKQTPTNRTPTARSKEAGAKPSEGFAGDLKKREAIVSEKNVVSSKNSQKESNKKETHTTAYKQNSASGNTLHLWIALFVLSFLAILVLMAKAKPGKDKENMKTNNSNSRDQKLSDIDSSVKTRHPDKRLMKKISYAYEKAEIEREHNGVEFEIPQKYTKTKNIKNTIRRKIKEN